MAPNRRGENQNDAWMQYQHSVRSIPRRKGRKISQATESETKSRKKDQHSSPTLSDPQVVQYSPTLMQERRYEIEVVSPGIDSNPLGAWEIPRPTQPELNLKSEQKMQPVSGWRSTSPAKRGAQVSFLYLRNATKARRATSKRSGVYAHPELAPALV